MGYAQDNQLFYYHNAEKIYLDKIENTKIINFNKTIETTQKDSICNRLKEVGYSVMEINPFIYEVSSSTAQLEKNNVISTSLESGYITYISDMLRYNNSDILWASNAIIVRIPLETDLRNLLKKNKIPMVDYRQIGHSKQTYVIELDVTEENAIEYANRLSEIGDVVWAQPSFWRSIHQLNPYYSSQWGLKNIGQYDGIPGIDINVTPAWEIATGTGVKVAVLDGGVDLTHPDLVNNLLPGYDATDAAYGGSNGGYGGAGCYEDAHGTACAGIIASENNNIGVKGVAFNSSLISVRIKYNYYTYFDIFGNCFHLSWSHDTCIINGINKAWHDYGADILSNSWGMTAPSQVINEAIIDALTEGRDSLGCIVVESENTTITQNYELSVYPNPTDGELIVEIAGLTRNDVQVIKILTMEVYDLTNRKVHQQTVNQSYSTLKMNELENGVYILKVWLDNGEVVVRKVVKQ